MCQAIETTHTPKRHTVKVSMSAEAATTFEHTSENNAQRVASEMAARGCGCEPYVDVFTFTRWNAQGMVVRKGQKSFKLAGFRKVSEKRNGSIVRDRNGKALTTLVRCTYNVFCRCQVKVKSDPND